MDIEEIYSRQSAVYGAADQAQILSLKTLVIGASGIGLECCKNLALSGVKSIDIFDPRNMETNLVSFISDIENNETIAERVARFAQEINPRCLIKSINNLILENITQYDAVAICDGILNLETTMQINEIARNSDIKFVLGDSQGLSLQLFSDFGDNHVVRDRSSEVHPVYIINAIITGKHTTITLHDDVLPLLQVNDWLKFTEVVGCAATGEFTFESLDSNPPSQGTTVLKTSSEGKNINNLVCKIIKITGLYEITIDLDTCEFSPYHSGGLVEFANVPSSYKYKPLREIVKSANPIITDYAKMENPLKILMAWEALNKCKETDQLIDELNLKHCFQSIIIEDKFKQELIQITNRREEKMIDDEFIDIYIKTAPYQITPLSSIGGGFLTQEILKSKGKYLPLNQITCMDWFEIYDKRLLGIVQPGDFHSYRGIFGDDVIKTLQSRSIFVAGAGALGCEFIKHLVAMGIGANGGQVIITDDDNIATSNLSRQFLYRSKHVGQMKAEVACEQASKMSSIVKFVPRIHRLNHQTDHIYDATFWQSQDFVVNALDNVAARQYTDQNCVAFAKPLLESGTLGTKCNAQTIVPFITESYNDSEDPPEKSIPMCTLKNFPFRPEHCVEWALDKFEEYFSVIPSLTRSFVNNPQEVFEELKSNSNDQDSLTKIKSIFNYLNVATGGDPIYIVNEVLDQFYSNYSLNIKQLLYAFPSDHMVDNTLFWSGPKRCPTPLDLSTPNLKEFLYVITKLILKILGLDIETKELVEQAIASYVVPDFTPKAHKVVMTQGDIDLAIEETDHSDEISSCFNRMTSSFEEYIGTTAGESLYERIELVDFDKDINEHATIIHWLSTFRSRNYSIAELSKAETRQIAGRIIPALSSTTSFIAGCVMMELLKLNLYLTEANRVTFQNSIMWPEEQNNKDHPDQDLFKNTFANLCHDYILFAEPRSTRKSFDQEFHPILLCPTKAFPKGFSAWDNVKISKSKSILVKELINEIRESLKYQLVLVTDTETVWYDKLGCVSEENMQLSIENFFHQIKNVNHTPSHVLLEITCSQGSADIVVPNILVELK